LGSITGASKDTSQRSGRERSARDSVKAREAVYIPWAMARGKPKAFALRAERWIGFTSPETAAQRRPASAGSVQRPVGRGATNSSRARSAGAADGAVPEGSPAEGASPRTR